MCILLHVDPFRAFPMCHHATNHSRVAAVVGTLVGTACMDGVRALSAEVSACDLATG